MKRMHIHIGVEQLSDGIQFYSALFGAEPDKVRDDYAKWMLEDPRLNFAISTRVGKGVDHLGLQVDDEAELAGLRERLTTADMALFDSGETTCCYARSDKSWATDPAGIPWEAYRTMADIKTFSTSDTENACCTPQTQAQPGADEPSPRTGGCCG